MVCRLEIHLDEGARLVEIRGKEARQWLKEARKDLGDLNLDFVGKTKLQKVKNQTRQAKKK
jgi:hypothetical protein